MASSQYPYSPLLGNYEPQKDPDGASISNHSTIGSKSGPRTPKQKHRVRFTPDCESLDGNDVRTPFDVRECGNEFKGKKPLPKPRINPAYSTKSSENSKTYVPGAVASEDITDSPARAPIPEAPSSSKDIQDTCSLAELHNCSGSIDPAQEISRKEMDIYDGVTSMAVSQPIAQERAKHLSRTVRDYSSSDYKGFSPLLGIASSPTPSSSSQQALDLSGIPMKNLQRRTRFSVEDDTDEDEEAELPKEKKPTSLAITVKQYIRRLKGASWPVFPAKFFDDQANPDEIESENRPWRRGPLAQVINMYKRQGTADFVEENYSDHPAIVAGEPASVAHARRCVSFEDQFHEGPCRKSSGTSLGTSGSNTPALGDQRWYKNEKFQSTGSLANLKTASKLLINPDSPGSSSPDQPNPPKPTLKTRSSMAFHAIFGKSNKETPGESMFILEHIRDTETRQLYLLKLCNALMACGAPTHRLEGRQFYFVQQILNEG